MDDLNYLRLKGIKPFYCCTKSIRRDHGSNILLFAAHIQQQNCKIIFYKIMFSPNLRYFSTELDVCKKIFSLNFTNTT